MDNILEFVQLVKEFQGACVKAPEEVILQMACRLHFKLRKEVFSRRHHVEREACDPTVLKLFTACTAALERLAEKLDSQGLAWLKASMASDKTVDPRQTLCHPTPYLEACIMTASMCTGNSFPSDIGESLVELAEVMPDYTKVSSINKDLMKDISPVQLDMCIDFKTKVEGKLREHADSFKSTINQLDRLNKKFEPFGMQSKQFWLVSPSLQSALNRPQTSLMSVAVVPSAKLSRV